MNMDQHDQLQEENSKLKKKLRNLMEDYKSLTRINNDLKDNIFIDDTTQLYNDRYLNIRLDEEMKRAKRRNYLGRERVRTCRRQTCLDKEAL